MQNVPLMSLESVVRGRKDGVEDVYGHMNIDMITPDSFAKAAIINQRKLSSFNNRNVSFYSSEG